MRADKSKTLNRAQFGALLARACVVGLGLLMAENTWAGRCLPYAWGDITDGGGYYIAGTPSDGNTDITNGTLIGNAGDDVVVNIAGTGRFKGREGNDRAGSLSGGLFNGGSGDDAVDDLNGGTFNGAAGNDQVGFMLGVT